MPEKTRLRSKEDWLRLGHRRLVRVIREAQDLPGIRKNGPKVNWKIDLKFVNRPEMTALQKKYMGKKVATDILSFPTVIAIFERGFLGDLVICLPVLKEQAKHYKHDTATELQVLLIHGLLHLLGFDHEADKGVSDKERKLMFKWEKILLDRTGFEVCKSLIERA